MTSVTSDHEPDAKRLKAGSPVKATDQWAAVDAFQRAFRNQQEFSVPLTPQAVIAPNLNDTAAAAVSSHPFAVGTLAPLFPDGLLRQVRQELHKLPFQHKSNDLYEFYQSPDIATAAEAYRLQALTQLKDTIYSADFVRFMERLTGIALNHHTVDMSAHRYSQGGYLLCHDDDIRQGKEGRRIAYIIYLVDEDWSEQDGGTLDLFAKDDHDQPQRIVHSLVPQWNTFAFFEVGATSFHQVAEVHRSTGRLSISGWLHGPIPEASQRPSHELVPQPVIHREALLLAQYIMPEFLDDQAIGNINKVFLEQSSIELQNFLQPELYADLIQTVTQRPMAGVITGPPNIMHYTRHAMPNDDATNVSPVAHLQQLFTSDAFSQLLCRYTNLDGLKRCKSEWRTFAPGHYTLLHDLAVETDGLDVLFTLPLPLTRTPPTDTTGTSTNRASPAAAREPFTTAWDEAWQGGMHYVADQETLLTLWPKPNTLSIVFRDQGTMRFVKYLNHQAKATRTEFAATFYEDP
ncbi:putative component of NuA3 histone acetyltransferase complex [Dimargaris xerosporica]|nr:putative component of NuA3 histone acetyltransferase complex [Dimargaris xerosporica]